MNKVRDAWYVRLPNGQEIKAKSTDAVVHHVETGNIPKNSRARRSREDEWMLLEWHSEFTEAVTGVPRPKEPAGKPSAPEAARLSGVAARLDPMRLRTVGVRGIFDDLIAAVDTAFAPSKLIVAAAAAGLIGLIWGAVPWLFSKLDSQLSMSAVRPERLIAAIATTLSIVVLALAVGLLARMTHIELSNMRRTGWREAMHGYFTPGLRLVVAYLIVLGGAYALISVARWLPDAIYSQSIEWDLPPWQADTMAAALSILGLMVEAVLWIMVGLSWLLAPALVIEDFGLLPGLGEWMKLIREHFNRIVLAETLTLALAVLIAVPIYLPATYALSHYDHLPLSLRWLAHGLALTGFLTFVAVANVFTYLDVKYEQS